MKFNLVCGELNSKNNFYSQTGSKWTWSTLHVLASTLYASFERIHITHWYHSRWLAYDQHRTVNTYWSLIFVVSMTLCWTLIHFLVLFSLTGINRLSLWTLHGPGITSSHPSESDYQPTSLSHSAACDLVVHNCYDFSLESEFNQLFYSSSFESRIHFRNKFIDNFYRYYLVRDIGKFFTYEFSSLVRCII